MKIEKEYNVQGLADKVKGCIKTVCETKSRNVSLDVITAQEIVDVMETVASWENKRTEACDTSKEALKQNCFGTYDEDYIECQCCDSKKGCEKKKEIEEEVLKEAPKRECFGMHSDDMECTVCLCEDECKEMRSEDGKSEYECFGSHINGNRKCNLCIYEKLCMIEKEEKEAVTNE